MYYFIYYGIDYSVWEINGKTIVDEMMVGTSRWASLWYIGVVTVNGLNG